MLRAVASCIIKCRLCRFDLYHVMKEREDDRGSGLEGVVYSMGVFFIFGVVDYRKQKEADRLAIIVVACIILV